jgi:hypothetical protein
MDLTTDSIDFGGSRHSAVAPGHRPGLVKGEVWCGPVDSRRDESGLVLSAQHLYSRSNLGPAVNLAALGVEVRDTPEGGVDGDLAAEPSEQQRHGEAPGRSRGPLALSSGLAIRPVASNDLWVDGVVRYRCSNAWSLVRPCCASHQRPRPPAVVPLTTFSCAAGQDRRRHGGES